jgi:hypothetical protein
VQQRGFFYTVAVIDRDGEDGRLVIDPRTGRILRFMPAYRMGDRTPNQVPVSYGSGAMPPVTAVSGPPRPPGLVPHVANRSPAAVPLPRPMPHAAAFEAQPTAPAAATPATAPAQQSVAVVQPKPAEPAAAAATTGAAKPTVQILPTQEMPKVQGLE